MARLISHAAVILSLIFLLILAYFPGLHGPYVLDDEPNITSVRAIALKEITWDGIQKALWSNDSGPLKRPLAALSFALNHYFAGGFDDTFPFKLTNVAIHIFNSILVYFLALRLVHSPALIAGLGDKQKLQVAGLAATLWALHPIQLTNVLYVVQRMNSLSALLVILGLIAYIHGREKLEKSEPAGFMLMGAGLVIGTLLGLGAKENAALLPLFAFVIEVTLYRSDCLNRPVRKRLAIFHFFLVLVPAAMFIGYLATHPDFVMHTYAQRNFSLSERLLTEARVLWFYLSLILVPSTHRLGLFHDDISLSTSLLDPACTLPAVAGICAAAAFALILRRKYPLAAFAILWFLVGHSLESSIFGLEIAFEHRNYLPSLGIIFAATYTIVHFLQKTTGNSKATTGFPVVIIMVFGFGTWSLAGTWKDFYTLAEHCVTNHPNSPRANNLAAHASILEKNDAIAAVRYILNGIHAAPHEAGFRMDLQLLLAQFSLKVTSAVAASGASADDKPVLVAGMPDSIKVSSNGGIINYYHESSNDEVIKTLLKERPITAHTIMTLNNLFTCVISNTAYCRPLAGNVLEWHVIAAKNTMTTDSYHRLILSNTARLYAESGDFQRAIGSITTRTDARTR